MSFVQVFEIASVAVRNLFWGGNLVSLGLVRNPKKMLQYISETLFLYKTFDSKRGVPQKNIFDVLPADNVEDIRLGSLKSGGTWFWAFSAYATDIVSLCLLCRIIKPRKVFEIGTLTGYTAFHFALNSPDSAQIYTLDLPMVERVTPQLKTTLVDGTHIESHLGRRQYAFNDTAVAEKITCLLATVPRLIFLRFWSN